DGGRAYVSRIDMDHHRPALLGHDRPVKADRMGLRHIRTHDENAIAVGEVARVIRRGAETERGAQTGHGRAVSEASLVLDGKNAEPSGKEFLDQVVLLVVERRAAKRGHSLEMIDRDSGGILFNEVAVPRLLDEPCDALHRPLKGLLLPLLTVRCSIFYRGLAVWI